MARRSPPPKPKKKSAPSKKLGSYTLRKVTVGRDERTQATGRYLPTESEIKRSGSTVREPRNKK